MGKDGKGPERNVSHATTFPEGGLRVATDMRPPLWGPLHILPLRSVYALIKSHQSTETTNEGGRKNMIAFACLVNSETKRETRTLFGARVLPPFLSLPFVQPNRIHIIQCTNFQAFRRTPLDSPELGAAVLRGLALASLP